MMRETRQDTSYILSLLKDAMPITYGDAIQIKGASYQVDRKGETIVFLVEFKVEGSE